MLDNLIIVATQVVVLFILIGIGFVCSKGKLLGENGAKQLTDIALYLSTPAVIIKSFQEVKYDDDLLINLGITALCAFLIHLLPILMTKVVFRDNIINRRKVLQFATVFSNCGFMSLPLQNAILGSKGVFYGSVFVAIFNIFVWSYGYIDMSDCKVKFTPKNLVLNPGILGTAAAAILFFLKLQLPEIIFEPVKYLAVLNTPVPMLVIGYYLSKTDFVRSFTDKDIYVSSFLRLAIIPICSLFAMWLFGVRGDVLTACTIAAAAPVAATTTMFSTKFNRDTDLSVGLVSATTLLSIVTMPLIIAIAQTIS